MADIASILASLNPLGVDPDQPEDLDQPSRIDLFQQALQQVSGDRELLAGLTPEQRLAAFGDPSQNIPGVKHDKFQDVLTTLSDIAMIWAGGMQGGRFPNRAGQYREGIRDTNQQIDAANARTQRSIADDAVNKRLTLLKEREDELQDWFKDNEKEANKLQDLFEQNPDAAEDVLDQFLEAGEQYGFRSPKARSIINKGIAAAERAKIDRLDRKKKEDTEATRMGRRSLNSAISAAETAETQAMSTILAIENGEVRKEALESWSEIHSKRPNPQNSTPEGWETYRNSVIGFRVKTGGKDDDLTEAEREAKERADLILERRQALSKKTDGRYKDFFGDIPDDVIHDPVEFDKLSTRADQIQAELPEIKKRVDGIRSDYIPIIAGSNREDSDPTFDSIQKETASVIEMINANSTTRVAPDVDVTPDAKAAWDAANLEVRRDALDEAFETAVDLMERGINLRTADTRSFMDFFNRIATQLGLDPNEAITIVGQERFDEAVRRDLERK